MFGHRFRLAALAAALTAAALARPSGAGMLTPTVSDSSPAQPGYEVKFFIDGDKATDYASDMKGAGTFVDFKFDGTPTIARVIYTDRTSSGGANGSKTGGPLDNVLKYDLIFSTDNIFGN